MVALGGGVVAVFPSNEDSQAEAYAKAIGGTIVKDFSCWVELVESNVGCRFENDDIAALIGDTATMRRLGYDLNLTPEEYVESRVGTRMAGTTA
ncbi:MAG: hypothetical protein KAX55_00540 [Propionivibrio sp.]|nr:hypothetical protein [Propionivibrio sp.]